MKKNNSDKKNVTSVDVAKLAGVSQSTVSRVFNPNNRSTVATEIRDRVLKAADELGYRRNFIASAVSSGITNIVGVVVGYGVGPFYYEVLGKLISEIQKIGKQCLVFKVEEQKDLDEIILNVLQFQVDSIVVLSPAISKKSIASCATSKTPVILFNRYIANVDVHCVYCDNLLGGMLAGEYIASHGHSKIGYVGFLNEVSSEIRRYSGFLAKLNEYDIHEIIEEFSEYTYASGQNVARDLLRRNDRPTALFCTSDLIAMGVMDVARFEFGLKIPDDLSVIGFDDVAMASWEAYSLTTIRQPIDKMVDATIDIILKSKESAEYSCQTIRIPLELIERNSTKKERR